MNAVSVLFLSFGPNRSWTFFFTLSCFHRRQNTFFKPWELWTHSASRLQSLSVISSKVSFNQQLMVHNWWPDFFPLFPVDIQMINNYSLESFFFLLLYPDSLSYLSAFVCVYLFLDFLLNYWTVFIPTWGWCNYRGCLKFALKPRIASLNRNLNHGPNEFGILFTKKWKFHCQPVVSLCTHFNSLSHYE